MLRYSNAGHIPALLYHGDGDSFSELYVKGSSLGWYEDMGLSSGETTVRQGDRLVLHSNGLIHARNREGELFGTGRLRQLISEGASLSPRQSSAAIFKALHRFTGSSPLADDVTLVIVDFLQ